MTIDLQRFCADEETDPRPYLWKPWSRSAYTYASNAKILVRVPRLSDVAENDKVPAADKLMEDTKTGEWMPVPIIAAPVTANCKTCHGRGNHECSCGDAHECGTCKGEGTVINTDWSATDVGNAKFANCYLALIQGWEIAPNGNEPAPIRCGEAEGLLMPMSK